MQTTISIEGYKPVTVTLEPVETVGKYIGGLLYQNTPASVRALPVDSKVGSMCLALCNAAAPVIDSMYETDLRTRVAQSVGKQCAVWLHG